MKTWIFFVFFLKSSQEDQTFIPFQVTPETSLSD